MSFKFAIKHRWNGSVLFEAELNASLETTSDRVKLGAAVKLAVKADANLAGANLAGANLADANLAGANLAGANLADANLADAYLAGAYLARANLARANLARANLARANLARANLAGANLADAKWRKGVTITKAPLQIHGLRWLVYILDTHMQIGCELHSHDEWAGFDDRRILEMEGRTALDFWRDHKAALMALCASHAPAKSEAA
ncbi:pentapeptide repeat-containing protein [Pelagibius sp.]|uniref:pentapeptide repeat-containing protein n=1 Tax=Pelagibius sp. TaxID=1931238 RepID=UPI003BAF2C18